MRFAAIAISLWLGLTAVTATPFPQFSSDVDGLIDVRPLGDSVDLGIAVDDSSLSRAAVDVPNSLNMTDLNDDGKDPHNLAVFRTSKPPNPANDRDFVFTSAVLYDEDECNQYEKVTKDQCKNKMPGSDQEDCNKKVEASKRQCVNDVKTMKKSRQMFFFPKIRIRSPQRLKSNDECNADAYTKVPLKWCVKVWGPDGQDHPTSFERCQYTVQKLTKDCIKALKVKNTRGYPYMFNVLEQWYPDV
ncbi:hypothetical protein HDU96_009630 [Phlyctochytrium bullatum]|nr:hypothetical protein HDU96_009630 [Phlyctochytrium bullatum]